jgi:hypothetical protein
MEPSCREDKKGMSLSIHFKLANWQTSAGENNTADYQISPKTTLTSQYRY